MRRVVVVAVVGLLSSLFGCDCTNQVGIPPADVECTADADCLSGFCRDGACLTGLPTEGEGDEGEGEGEGEPGEGEGEGEPEASFVIAPTSLALPAAAIGQSSTGTAQIVNTGDVTLTVTSVTSSNAAFVVTAPANGATVTASSSLPLDLRFTPTAAGPSSSTITVTAGGTARTMTASSSATQTLEDGALLFSAGPDDAGVGLPACECSTAISPANVDVVYAAAGGTCRKPANIECGVSDSCAACSLGTQGSARWRSGRTETPRQGDVAWIVDEEIVHQGAGGDGDFVLSAVLVDDCTTTVASIGQASNETCCNFIDCQGGALACYPYEAPVSCALDCDGFVGLAMSQDCMARGPVLVRARLDVGDGPRDFCLTMTEGQTAEIARVRRTAGAFSVTSVGAVVEVADGAACP
ncbi:MAG: hypothetical protein Q8O67_20200 [Deltaproteobacteria bacterium]|nr:hypothetical protein [Deltaproteobacteria bacterium]